jgi:hypothetical protein
VFDSTNPVAADHPANYSIFDPGSPDFNQPHHLNPLVATIARVNDRSVKITFTPSTGPGTTEFQAGDWVNVVIKRVEASDGTPLEEGLLAIARQVPGKGGTGRIVRDVEDAISYPILTEEIGYRPSPVGIATGGGNGSAGGNLGQLAAQTVSEVLGWKPNASDPKGFIGALTQSFTLTEVEGHTESTWMARPYVVQTELGGGIMGAQASLYSRARNSLDAALPLLDGLYPLDPEADPEYVKALREMVRSQMSEIVKELGVVGLPSILRIDTYFDILLGQNPAKVTATGVQFDPDQIAGTLGELRDTYGIQFIGNQFNNSVEDEQDITNFRVISDYMTSLMQSWIANRQFFRLGTKKPAFFGTQLVLISRQFTTICETVNEVRFALDSVFIGPNERQTLLLEFQSHSLAPMFFEGILLEIERFSKEEAPRLLRDGGKIAVTNNILPVAVSLKNLIEEAHVPRNIDDLPDGFKTARVRNALDDLQDQLELLIDLIEQVEQQVPSSEEKLVVSGTSDPAQATKGWTIRVFGSRFQQDSKVSVHSRDEQDLTRFVEFFSAERIDVTIDVATVAILGPGFHSITITNPDGESATLPQAFFVSGDANVGYTVSRQEPMYQAPPYKAPSMLNVSRPLISHIKDPVQSAQGQVLPMIGRFQPGAKVRIYSPTGQNVTPTFRSTEQLDVPIDAATVAELGPGYHDIEVTNPNGQTTILRRAIFIKIHADGRYTVTRTAPEDAGEHTSERVEEEKEVERFKKLVEGGAGPSQRLKRETREEPERTQKRSTAKMKLAEETRAEPTRRSRSKREKQSQLLEERDAAKVKQGKTEQPRHPRGKTEEESEPVEERPTPSARGRAESKTGRSQTLEVETAEASEQVAGTPKGGEPQFLLKVREIPKSSRERTQRRTKQAKQKARHKKAA